MKIIRVSKDLRKQMEDWYEKRTKAHIERVVKYCNLIADYDDKFSELRERAKIHDDSKFESPEKEPYIYITWRYKCKEEGMDFEDCNPPEDIEDKMFEATLHHIKNNKHHPEYHTDDVALNKNDRDKPPEKTIDATKMKDVDVAEMCADWFAMSEEKNSNPKGWADMNVDVRWKFTDEHKNLIYELIEEVW